MLRPFFSFYGGKFRMAKRLGEPQHDTIVEPFAGSAGYSCYWAAHARKVILVEIDPTIAAIWRYLIKVKESEIEKLPTDIDSTEGLHACQEAKWLIGFWFNRGQQRPAVNRQATEWAKYPTTMLWNEKVRARIASQLRHIRGWKLIEGGYESAPAIEAHWHIDPPYQHTGYGYRHNNIDYPALARWSRSRQGFVQVCEHTSADWLPFIGFTYSRGSLGRNRNHVCSSEAVFQFGKRNSDSLFKFEKERNMASAMEKRLTKATGVKINANDRQGSLADIVRAINAMSKGEWNRLTAEDQDWYNSKGVIDQLDKRQDYWNDLEVDRDQATNQQLDGEPQLDDFPQSAAEEAEAESEAEAAEAAEAKQGKAIKKGKPMAKAKTTTPAKRVVTKAGNGKAAPPKKAEKAAAPVGRRTTSRNKESAPSIIRAAIIKNPTVTGPEIMEILQKKGNSCSMVAMNAIRNNAYNMLVDLKAQDKLKNMKL
jgi:hypothetical protein